MDVTASASAASAAVEVTRGVTAPSQPTPTQAAPEPPPIEASELLPGAPSGAPSQPPDPADSNARGGIAPAIAKIFGSGVPQPITLNVSYRVVRGPNEIVTVFTDPKTGKEVAQFPPEVLVQIAQFFDHNTGVTLDKDV